MPYILKSEKHKVGTSTQACNKDHAALVICSHIPISLLTVNPTYLNMMSFYKLQLNELNSKSNLT